MASHFYPWQSTDDEQEFTVSVHMWLSAQTNASYKGPKKTLNRREKSTPSFEDARKLKGREDSSPEVPPYPTPDLRRFGFGVSEKTSWIATAPRGSTAGGRWRPGSCRLREQNNRCTLNIFIEDVTLLRTINIHLLNHTDIRPADPSLFLKKHCITIDSFDQRPPERIYLMFADEETCSTWLCLLRSFCVLEIYGRWINPEDGGLYRLWRQIELTVTQARNLGLQPAFNKSLEGQEAPESDPETMAPDVDVFCEVWLNGTLCARTSVKKGSLGSPEWHETFTFPDLPPFDKLELVVWQEVGKAGKSEVMGKVKIPLATFRRGESVDGRYPVLRSGSVAGDLRVGEMRLKVKVDEEVVLPYNIYHKLYQVITSRNFLSWLSDMDKIWKCRSALWSLISVSLAANRLIENVIEHSDEEIAIALQSRQTLFRGNTIFTKTMELCMLHFGKSFLEASIGSVVRRLCTESVAIEIDPVRLSSKSSRDIEKNTEHLVHWCSEFWNQIYYARNECPNELRRLFQHIRKKVGESAAGMADGRQLQWQSISSFCFLRFIVPAILNPHLFGLWPGLPHPTVQRSLTLVGKVIQSLSNLNTSTFKEDFMRGMREFLIEHSKAMTDYLTVVSSPNITGNHQESIHARTPERRELQTVVSALRRRLNNMPSLSRQSIPTLPHMLDTPRHLAIITSVVLRHTEGPSRSLLTQSSIPVEGSDYLTELAAQCLRIEECAKERVKQLAKATMITKPVSPSHPPMPLSVQPFSPIHNQRRRHLRPATAPASGSESDTSRRRDAFSPSLGPPDALTVSRTSTKHGPDTGSYRLRGRARTGSTGSMTHHDITGSNLRLAVTRSRSTSPPEDGVKRKKGILRSFLGTRK